MQEYSSSNNKLFSFEEKDGQLFIIMDSGAESRVVYGNFKPITEYHLYFSAHNKIYSWNVNGNILTKGYNYKLTATGTKTNILESGTLIGNKKIEKQGYYYDLTKKKKTYTIKASGKKTITLESGLLKADTTEDIMKEFYALDLTKQKYQFIGGIGGSYEENPETGDNSLWIFTIGGISMLGLACTARYLKKEEDEEIVL